MEAQARCAAAEEHGERVHQIVVDVGGRLYRPADRKQDQGAEEGGRDAQSRFEVVKQQLPECGAEDQADRKSVV